MVDRALTLDPEQRPVSAPAMTLDHQPFGRAGDVVGHDLVDGDAPAGDRDPGLAGGHELRREPAPAGFPVELQAYGHLAQPTVGADREHGARSDREVLERGYAEVTRRPAQVADLPAAGGGRRGQLGVVREEVVQSVLDVEPVRERVLDHAAKLGRELAAGRGDADQERCRTFGQHVLQGGHDGMRAASPGM